MATYCIEVMKGPTPTYFVNGQNAGTSVSDVRRMVVGPPLQMVSNACKVAKEDGVAVYISTTVMGWHSYIKLDSE